MPPGRRRGRDLPLHTASYRTGPPGVILAVLGRGLHHVYWAPPAVAGPFTVHPKKSYSKP